MDRRDYRWKVQHWAAGSNQGAYLPNPDTVMHGGTLVDAMNHLIADIKHELDTADDMPDHTRAELVRVWDALSVLDRAALTVDAEQRRGDSGNWEDSADGWQYWIMPCYTVGCDQVDTE
jgi:hypothetical protein